MSIVVLPPGSPAPGTPPPPPAPTTPGTPALNADQAKMVRNWVAASALADAVAKDLYAFAYRIRDLHANPTQKAVPCADLPDATLPKISKDPTKAPPAPTCVSLFAVGDPP